MPLRKHGTIVKTALVSAVIGCAMLPATANAGYLNDWYRAWVKATQPVAAPAATPAPVATSAPVATAAPVATPAAAAPPASGSDVTSSAVPAGVGCTPLPVAKAFQGVDGDDADYSLAPNGGFESGSGGWTLSNGARIASGNENLGVAPGRRSLQLPLSASATSPAFCVDESHPHFRFAYKIDNASVAGFIAYVIYRDSAGAITSVELVSSRVLSLIPTRWQASPRSPLATLIPLNATSQTASVQLKITSLNPTELAGDALAAVVGNNPVTSATMDLASRFTALAASLSGAVSPIANIGVTVDSIMVDPYRRG